MYKKINAFILLSLVVILLVSCSITRKPLNRISNFDNLLAKVEGDILNEKWNVALKNTDSADKSWKSVKPLLQIDIDHDYVNDIEDCLIRLKGYIETQEKSEALITVRLLKDFWNTIGEM